VAGLNVSIGLAFLAGLASFLSPCVFSLVPAYIGYLGGRSAGGDARSRWPLLHGWRSSWGLVSFLFF
jgi:cytochrome c-type biogenesis protein